MIPTRRRAGDGRTPTTADFWTRPGSVEPESVWSAGFWDFIRPWTASSKRRFGPCGTWERRS